MRHRLLLTAVLAWTTSVAPIHAADTLQQKYLNIYLKINDAEHLEKQGDYRGALADFQDCYTRLAQIHSSDPQWESALVMHRMEDCKTKIQELTPKASAQTLPTVPPPVTPSAAIIAPTNAVPNAVTPGPTSEEVTSLRLQLHAVQDELSLTKNHLSEALGQLETYRTQLATVNQQLSDLKAKQSQSVDDQMGKLLSQNKDLSAKLAEAQKELDGFKTNPKSKLALIQTQLKNLQQQYDASQVANTALQNTTTTLKQQLDQAQNDLVAANQKLAAAGPSSADYQILKRENEVMRGILTRELQEQAHRDMAKRLYQEEYDRLKLNSKVLQEQIDIVASPMTPPSNDEERQLLASIRTSSPDVAPPPNGFAAPASVNPPAAATNTVAVVTPPAANATAPSTADAATNAPTVTIVSSQTPPAPDPNPAPSAPASNDVAVVTSPAANAAAPDPTAPIPPNSTPAPPAADVAVANPPTPPAPTPAPPAPAPETVTKVPAATTEVTDKTITHGDGTETKPDATAYSYKARLPDDMRETAQQAADLFKNQKYDESAAKYQSIIDKYPESLYAWSNLGVVRFQQGKFDDALKALQQAVKLSPTDAFSYSNLGIVYYQLNQFENAIDALNSAKALDPTDAKTHNYLGCACSQKGWQEVAEKEFRKAIELDPNFGDAHFNLALVYATSKPPSLELARREYNRALELGIAKDNRLEKLLGSATASTAP